MVRDVSGGWVGLMGFWGGLGRLEFGEGIEFVCPRWLEVGSRGGQLERESKVELQCRVSDDGGATWNEAARKGIGRRPAS